MARLRTISRLAAWLCVGGAVTVGVWIFMHEVKSESSTVPYLRVPRWFDLSPEEADPARIVVATTWGYLENLTSPLIEWDKNGQLVSGVAQSFEWKGNELHLKIRSDYRTVDGFPITPADVAFSLKRVIFLARNTHGFLADFLCGDKALASVDDECDGIKIAGDSVVLSPYKGKSFLTKMLTSMDFAILLRSQVDPKTLAITSFRNSTGPYYLVEGESGSLKYVANKKHWRYSEKMPQEVALVSLDFAGKTEDPATTLVFEKFSKGEIDLLNNDASDRPDLYLKLSRKNSSLEIERTMEIGRTIAVFTPRGIKDLDRAKRFRLGRAIKRIAASVLVDNLGSRQETEQFFATFGDGSLSEEQLNKIKEMFDAVDDESSGSGLRIAVSPTMKEIHAALQNGLPGAQVTSDVFDYYEGKLGPSDHPHVYIVKTDTSWSEDLGLLSYSTSMKFFFPLDQDEGREWLRKYVEIEDRNQRLFKLRELHYRALSEPWIVPIAAESYHTIVRKPWTYQGPTLFASGALWHLRHP